MIGEWRFMTVSNFKREYLEYLFPQRTRLETEYALTRESTQEDVDAAISKMIQKDYLMVNDYLPIKCESILDIGCGLALSDVALYNHYKNNYNNKPNIFLLDKNEFDTTKISGFNKEYKGYNSMDAAHDILTTNGVDSDKINLYETDNFDELYDKKYDIIITNPPYKDYFTDKKNIMIEAMDKCFEVANEKVILLIGSRTFMGFTPIRLQRWNDMGWGISDICVINIPKWYGRYYIITFEKDCETMLKWL